jgi:outer membrane lipoprotein-sorting protein
VFLPAVNVARPARIVLVAAGLLSFRAGSPLAAADIGMPPDAAAALKKSVARYSEGSAHAGTFTQTYTPAGFTTARRETGTVWIQAPQRLRFEYGPPQNTIYTYDAGVGRFFSPEDKQLTVRRLTPEERARLPIVFLTDPGELASAYEISVESAPEGSRLLLKPRTPREDLAWLRLTIGPAGEVSELSYEDGSGNRTAFRFGPWRTEKARPPADFRITGPPGTRIVEN